MEMPQNPPSRPTPWTSLWVVAGLSLAAQLALCQFFSFGQSVPTTIDINPSNLWKFGYAFPPTGTFPVLNWLGVAEPPTALNPFTLGAHLSPWFFFTAYAPVMATLALLAMAAFLRELELPRPAALFGAVVYAWQGDVLPFVFPGHFGYITTWPFYAIAAWGALRSQRTGLWPYAAISGACCGTMVQLQADRGAIASLLIAALYLAPLLRGEAEVEAKVRGFTHLALCVTVAGLVALGSILALFQTNIENVKLGGHVKRAETYRFVTQFSLGPAETLTYLVPGAFGWHSHHNEGPYWGSIGETNDWPTNQQDHKGTRNYNLAISTTGTVATALALIGALLLLPFRLLGPATFSERQLFFGRVLLVLGLFALILSWGWHTPFYRSLFALPLMDKWRNPLKWLELTNFALVALSAYGVQHLLASLNPAQLGLVKIRRRLAWTCIGLMIALCLGLAETYPYAAYTLSFSLQRDGYDTGEVASIMSTLHLAFIVAVVYMALFSIVLVALWRPVSLRTFSLVNPWLDYIWKRILREDTLPLTLALSLAALSAAQLGWVAAQFLDSVNLRAVTELNPLVLKLQGEQGENAVRVSVATEDPMLNMLLLNQFNAARISCLDISAASRIPDDIGAFFSTLDRDRPRLWLLAGVKDVAMPQEWLPQLRNDADIAADVDHADGYTLQPTADANTPSHALVTMRDYLSKATLVPKAEVIPTSEGQLKRLKDPAWNPRETVILSAQLPPVPEVPAGAGGAAQVELKTYTPRRIEVTVHGGNGGYLLINDQYDPDWTVRVNGHLAPLLRADFILRAVRVPPGDSTVMMDYATRYHVGKALIVPALWVSFLSDGTMLAAWALAGFALWRRKSD